jgi:hypothetical protein
MINAREEMKWKESVLGLGHYSKIQYMPTLLLDFFFCKDSAGNTLTHPGPYQTTHKSITL